MLFVTHYDAKCLVVYTVNTETSSKHKIKIKKMGKTDNKLM